MALPDHIDVAGKTLTNILTEPVTWAPFVPVAASFAFFGVAWWICFPVSLVIGLGEFHWWKRRWGWMQAKAKFELYQAYFAQENARQQNRLDTCTVFEVTQEVREALKIKRDIEQMVLKDEIVTDEELVLIKQVSSVCEAMCEGAARLSIGTNSRAEVRAKIDEFRQARQTVENAYSHFLDMGKETLQSPVTAASKQLADTVRNASEVREYVSRSMEEKRRKIAEALENQNKETPT